MGEQRQRGGSDDYTSRQPADLHQHTPASALLQRPTSAITAGQRRQFSVRNGGVHAGAIAAEALTDVAVASVIDSQIPLERRFSAPDLHLT